MCVAHKAPKFIKQTPVLILRRIFSPSLAGKGLTRGASGEEAKCSCPPQLVQSISGHVNHRCLDELSVQVVFIWVFAAALKIDTSNNLNACLLQTERQTACSTEQIDRANVRHSALPFRSQPDNDGIILPWHTNS